MSNECRHPNLRDSSEQQGVAIYVCTDCRAEVRLIEYEVRRPVECDCKDYCNGPDTTDRQCRAENGTF
jgi:hypothetical protein